MDDLHGQVIRKIASWECYHLDDFITLRRRSTSFQPETLLYRGLIRGYEAREIANMHSIYNLKVLSNYSSFYMLQHGLPPNLKVLEISNIILCLRTEAEFALVRDFLKARCVEMGYSAPAGDDNLSEFGRRSNPWLCSRVGDLESRGPGVCRRALREDD